MPCVDLVAKALVNLLFFWRVCCGCVAGVLQCVDLVPKNWCRFSSLVGVM